MWIAGAILGLTLAGACNLNPQPLPPQGLDENAGDDGSAPGTVGSSGSASSSGSGGMGFVSSSGSNSGGSGSGPVVSDDAGAALPTLDASAEDGGTTTPPVDAATDAGVPTDTGGGSDGASPDGSPDASPDAAPDAAVDDASTGDAAGDVGCVHATDCYVSHPGACNACAWPFNYPVCVAHECGCACDERDAAGE